MSKLILPKRGFIYTLYQIENELELRDGPHLGFEYKGVKCVVQTSHLKAEELLSVPGFADSRWVYERETHEWIPVFRYVDGRPITEFVDLEPVIDHPIFVAAGTADTGFWATPKGFPREQYYADPANVESTTRTLT